MPLSPDLSPILHTELHMTGKETKFQHPRVTWVTCSIHSSGSGLGQHTQGPFKGCKQVCTCTCSLLCLPIINLGWEGLHTEHMQPLWTPTKKKGTRWGKHHAYPVTVRWLCSYAQCISRIASLLGKIKSFIYCSWWIFERLPNVSTARILTLKNMFIIHSFLPGG